jgi:hypothetical protein
VADAELRGDFPGLVQLAADDGDDLDAVDVADAFDVLDAERAGAGQGHFDGHVMFLARSSSPPSRE